MSEPSRHGERPICANPQCTNRVQPQRNGHGAEMKIRNTYCSLDCWHAVMPRRFVVEDEVRKLAGRRISHAEMVEWATRLILVGYQRGVKSRTKSR